MEQAQRKAMRSTAGAGGDEEDGAEAELRKARFFAQQKMTPTKKNAPEKLAKQRYKPFLND